MPIQTIFKAGNSSVVAIPSQILASLHLKSGDRVVVEAHPEAEVVTIHKPKTSGSVTDKEFESWLKRILEEDAELLDLLA